MKANKKYSDAEMSCGTALMKNFKKLDEFRSESQKQDFLAFLTEQFTVNKVPQEYASTILENIKSKGVKWGTIYLGDIVLAGMGLRVCK